MKNLFTLLLTFFFISVSNGQTEKANSNTSRSNIKHKVNKPSDSLPEKANHNTARSNKNTVKGDGENTIEGLNEKEASQTNPYFKNNTLSGEMPNQQKANINTSRSNTKGLAKPADSIDNSDTPATKAKKVKFKAGVELSDKVN